MVQTRNQKKIIDNFNNLNEMEKNAINMLIEISEMETIKDNILDNYSNEDINKFKLEITRKRCKDTLSKHEVVIPDLVKYSPYNGSYETQIKEALKGKNMETYIALVNYKSKMKQYDNINNYLKNNFNSILNDITDNDVLNYINDNKNKQNVREDIIMLNRKKEELQELKDIKDIKELIKIKKLIVKEEQKEIKDLNKLIKVRNLIIKEINNEVIDLETKYNILIENFKNRYNC